MNDWDLVYPAIQPTKSASTTSLSSSACTSLCEDDDMRRSKNPVVFDLLKVIGAGSFGTVLLSCLRNDPTKLFAVKVVPKRKLREAHWELDLRRLDTEKKVMAIVDHPFITSLYCAFETRESLNFVMEFCPGGDLYFLLDKFQNNRLPEKPHVAFYGACMVLALDHLHSMNIAYRDLKPENLFIGADGFLRLGDFGFARPEVENDSTCTSFCGSEDYIAPEVIAGKGYGLAADLWSLGCVLYELMTGFPPFYTNQSREAGNLFSRIRLQQVNYPAYLSKQAKSLLKGLLAKDPADRLGSRSMQDVLDHPFFEDINWNQLMAKEATPPFIPKMKHDRDTRHFEQQFTQQQVLGRTLSFHLDRTDSDSDSENSFTNEDTRCFEDFDWCAEDAQLR